MRVKMISSDDIKESIRDAREVLVYANGLGYVRILKSEATSRVSQSNITFAFDINEQNLYIEVD